MPKKLHHNSQNWTQAFFKLLPSGLIFIAVFIALFPWLYEVKTKAGINISSKYHAGPFFEKHTHGLFKCEWLYPYHCDRPIRN
ncbi:hypothetical protein B4U84_11190 [Westiellopsis prolifica IICB1]|nr:hypothetical protein B4U84_11190 [Westiellopsis prolifica IICB1]